MDSGLDKVWILYNLWENHNPEIGNYLCRKNIKYRVSFNADATIYTIKMSSEEVLILRLLFSRIIITDNLKK